MPVDPDGGKHADNEEAKLSFGSASDNCADTIIENKEEVGAFIDKTFRMPTLGRQNTFSQMQNKLRGTRLNNQP